MQHLERTQPSVILTVLTSNCAPLQQPSLILAFRRGITSTSIFRIHRAYRLVLGTTKLAIRARTTRLMAAAMVLRTTNTRSVALRFLHSIQQAGPTSKLTSPTMVDSTSNFALFWSTTMLLPKVVIRFTIRPPCLAGTSTTSALEALSHSRVGWAFVAFCRMSKAAKTIQTVTEFSPSKQRRPQRLFSPLTFSTL